MIVINTSQHFLLKYFNNGRVFIVVGLADVGAGAAGRDATPRVLSTGTVDL